MALTPKQQAFVNEYLLDLNATQAAIRAGYAPKRADAIGFENLRKPEIAAAIGSAKAERCERTQIDADWLLQRLYADVVADLGDLYHRNGAIKPVHEWPDVWRQGLAADVDHDKETGAITRVKVADRTKLKELLGRHVTVQAWKDNTKVEVVSTLIDKLNAGLARAGVKPE